MKSQLYPKLEKKKHGQMDQWPVEWETSLYVCSLPRMQYFSQIDQPKRLPILFSFMHQAKTLLYFFSLLASDNTTSVSILMLLPTLFIEVVCF